MARRLLPVEISSFYTQSGPCSLLSVAFAGRWADPISPANVYLRTPLTLRPHYYSLLARWDVWGRRNIGRCLILLLLLELIVT